MKAKNETSNHLESVTVAIFKSESSVIRGGWWTIGHSFVRPGYGGNVGYGEVYRYSGRAVNSSPSEFGHEWPTPSKNFISRRDPFGFGLDVYELERRKQGTGGRMKTRSPQHLALGSQVRVLGFSENAVLHQAPASL